MSDLIDPEILIDYLCRLDKALREDSFGDISEAFLGAFDAFRRAGFGSDDRAEAIERVVRDVIMDCCNNIPIDAIIDAFTPAYLSHINDEALGKEICERVKGIVFDAKSRALAKAYQDLIDFDIHPEALSKFEKALENYGFPDAIYDAQQELDMAAEEKNDSLVEFYQVACNTADLFFKEIALQSAQEAAQRAAQHASGTLEC